MVITLFLLLHSRQANDYQRFKEKNPDQDRQNKLEAYLNFVLFDSQFKLAEETSWVSKQKLAVMAPRRPQQNRM